MLVDRVGVVAPGLSLDRQAVLVSVARSRGIESGLDGELAAAREQLASVGASVPTLAEARRRVAETESHLDAKRERVATLRGRTAETDDESVQDAYREAIRELSEAETEHVAAREALTEARQRARDARDERERRLELQDRVRNLERRVREELAATVRPSVDGVIPSVPGSTATTFSEADAITAALAALRVGRPRLPVVLACGRFPDAKRAETWLRAPVLRRYPEG
jgi:chromosome segregation ATPase